MARPAALRPSAVAGAWQRRIGPTALVVSLLSGVCSAVRPQTAGSQDSGSVRRGNDLATETFQEGFAHLHVYPSSHRAVLKRELKEPTLLAFTFSLKATAQVLEVVVPPGYEFVKAGPGAIAAPGCEGVTTQKSTASMYAVEMEAQSLASNIVKCEFSDDRAINKPTTIWLHLKARVPGLSWEADPVKLEGGAKRYWWFFSLRVWNPYKTPPRESNVFLIRWAMDKGAGWKGYVSFDGWPLLGDWDCLYSDWDGWGTCTARCGGGIMRERRRVLMEPPEGGTGNKCQEALIRESPCNEHPCLFPCKQKGALASKEFPPQCTAKCGGGLQVERSKWEGEFCPTVQDMSAVHLTPCNDQPCQMPCVRADKWTPVSECSALCGAGTFWLMRQVLQKSAHDVECKPFWRQQKCIRQDCGRLTINRPDQNLIPYVKKAYRVAVIFQTPNKDQIRRIELFAPQGYTFLANDGKCQLYQHDLLPYFDGCEVGATGSSIVLSMSTPLPPSVSSTTGGNYQFQVDVKHPDCPKDDWVVDPALTTLTCRADPDWNRWRIEFANASPMQESWESYIAEGYVLYATAGVDKDSFKLQDKRTCTGLVKLASDPTKCLDTVGGGTSDGATLQVSDCAGDRPSTKFITPPSGVGLLRLAANDKKCVRPSKGKDGDNPGLEVSSCAANDDSSMQWVMPQTAEGAIRWAQDPDMCLEVGPDNKMQLSGCGPGSVTPALGWKTPCEGVETQLIPKTVSDTVLIRKTRPRFCTERFACPDGCVCSEDGICTKCPC